MSRRSLALDQLPHWPRFMPLLVASAYLGVSPTVFTAEVRSGIWPAPRMRGTKGGLPTWDKAMLDATANKDAGLGPDQAYPAATPSIADEEIRMLFRAKTPKGRPQAGR